MSQSWCSKLKLKRQCPRCDVQKTKTKTLSQMWCSSVSSEQWYPVSNDDCPSCFRRSPCTPSYWIYVVPVFIALFYTKRSRSVLIAVIFVFTDLVRLAFIFWTTHVGQVPFWEYSEHDIWDNSDFGAWHLGQRFLWKHTSGTVDVFEPHIWDSYLFGNVQNMTSGTAFFLEAHIWDRGFFWTTHVGQVPFWECSEHDIWDNSDFGAWHLGQRFLWKHTSGTVGVFEPHIWDSYLFGNVQNMTSGTIASFEIVQQHIWDICVFGAWHLGQWDFLNHTSGIRLFWSLGITKNEPHIWDTTKNDQFG